MSEKNRCREMNEHSQFASDYFNEKADKEIYDLWAMVNPSNPENCLSVGWDGEGGDPITTDDVIYWVKVIEALKSFFRKECGLLNNRRIEISCCPIASCHAIITLEYAEAFEINIFCSHESITDASFQPRWRYKLDGSTTIADRNFGMVFAKDVLKLKKATIEQLMEFLNEGFFDHKWQFQGDELWKK